MLEFSHALTALTNKLKLHRPTRTTTKPLSELVGYVLAEDIQSNIDVPPADNSAMDGYALNTESVPQYPLTLAISQVINAGAVSDPLEANTTARIFTGAEIPEGANCVVMQENCERTDQQVIINSGASDGGNIRKRGQDIQSGETILKQGHRLKAQDIGLLASIGIQSAMVYERPRVAVLSTGDELVAPGEALAKGQIYNSNRYMIEAACEQLNCELIGSEYVRDSLDATITALNTLKEKSDIVVSCGGVSVGDEDHVKNAVNRIGNIDFWKIRIKPGKPLAFGKLQRNDNSECIFLGLPGNPVSAFVTLHLFGKLILANLQGEIEYQPTRFYYPANFETKGNNTRPQFVRVKTEPEGASLYPNQSSGVLSSVSWANALALVPENTAIQQGTPLEVFPI